MNIDGRFNITKYLSLVATLVVSISLSGCGNGNNSEYNLPKEMTETIPDGTSVGSDASGSAEEDEISKVKTSIVPEGTVVPIDMFSECGGFDTARVEDMTFSADFYADTLAASQGNLIADFELYTQEMFDAEAISSLEQGNIIVINGESIEVESVRTVDDVKCINQDPVIKLKETEDGKAYYYLGEDDYTSYTDLGRFTLNISGKVVFTDGADFSTFPDTIIVPPVDLLDYINYTSYNFFTKYNTTVRIQNGKVTEIHRSYTP